MKRYIAIAVFVAVAAVVLGILSMRVVRAQAVPIDGVYFDVGESLADNLARMKGRVVYVTLNSGAIYAGSVKDCSDSLLHLEQIFKNESYDALIPIVSIDAVDAPFREY